MSGLSVYEVVGLYIPDEEQYYNINFLAGGRVILYSVLHQGNILPQ